MIQDPRSGSQTINDYNILHTMKQFFQILCYGIADVKVDFILLQKIYVIPRVGRFV